MTADPLPAQPVAATTTWQTLDDCVDEIAALVESRLAPQEFWRKLLDRTLRTLSAAGGTVWLRDAAGRLTAAAQVEPEGSAQRPANYERRHAQLLAHVAETGLALSLPPRSSSTGDVATDNPTPYLLLLAPVVSDEQTLALVEVLQRPTDAPTAVDGYLQFLTAVSELGADYERKRQLGDLRERAGTWSRFDRFTQSVHRSLRVRDVAATAANDLRSLVNCDRVTMALVRGRRVRVESISGVDTIERRSAAVRQLTQLIKTSVRIDEPLRYPEEAGSLPPQIEQALEAYLDQSHARQLLLIPLHRPEEEGSERRPKVIGALVVEYFTSAAAEGTAAQIDSAAAQIEIAMANALEFEAVPLVGLWRALGRARWLVQRGQLPKTLLAVAAIVAAVAALIYVPVDFTVEGRGELWPHTRRDVFAPVDGTIADIRVKHGDHVAAGDTLVVLRKPQLEFERTRLAGELQTARKRLSALQAARYGGTTAAAEARDQVHQRTADEEEVKELLKSLTAQLELLGQQEAELTVKSPIDGEVLTWDVAQLLEARPVERGRLLLTIGDERGPWELDMRVADDRIGHVLAAQQNSAAPLGVSFLLATDPDHTYEGTVRKVAMTTDATDKTAGPQVAVEADIDREAIPRLRPGASVVARIDCGRRSLGYVWLHDLWDAFRTRVLF